jgi:peptide deformylase
MTKLNILRFPNKRLRIKAKEVLKVDETIKTLISNMFETMADAEGIGLAATQVDVHQQIVVVDISKERNQPLCFINPKIIQATGHREYEEGCLSVPEYKAMITRAEKITIVALDETGQEFELEAEGLLSTCIQHELDHLKGKLFVDYLSKLKQQRLKKRFEKLYTS